MRLIFHGELKKLFGESFTMNSSSIHDAVEGFSRQQPNWPRSMPIEIVGYDSPEKMLECPEEVHLMPAMIGSGGRFGQILMGAALVVIGVLLLPYAHAFAVSLIVSGSVMILQGVVSLFMKAPSSTSVNNPESSKYLAVNKNTTAVGTPMTMAWGTIDLAGHWLSLQSDSNNLAFGVFPANPT
jgi:predicted phage tail protein